MIAATPVARLLCRGGWSLSGDFETAKRKRYLSATARGHRYPHREFDPDQTAAITRCGRAFNSSAIEPMLSDSDLLIPIEGAT
jgi:hypothetical protein